MFDALNDTLDEGAGFVRVLECVFVDCVLMRRCPIKSSEKIGFFLVFDCFVLTGGVNYVRIVV